MVYHVLFACVLCLEQVRNDFNKELYRYINKYPLQLKYQNTKRFSQQTARRCLRHMWAIFFSFRYVKCQNCASFAFFFFFLYEYSAGTVIVIDHITKVTRQAHWTFVTFHELYRCVWCAVCYCYIISSGGFRCHIYPYSTRWLHWRRKTRLSQWAFYQIRKIAYCACAGNAGNVPPPPPPPPPDADFKRNR